jgi:hypothetical protein
MALSIHSAMLFLGMVILRGLGFRLGNQRLRHLFSDYVRFFFTVGMDGRAYCFSRGLMYNELASWPLGLA